MEVSGLNELSNTFNNASRNFNREAEITINRIGNKLLRKCKLKSPVDTGQLRRTWRYKPQSNLEGLVFNNVDYIMHVEYGHRTRGGNGFVDGRYMLTKSVAEMEKELEKEIEIMVDNLFK